RRRSGQGTERAGAGGATNPGSTCPVGYGAGGATIACAPVATWCGGRGTASAASPDAGGSSPRTFCLPIAGPGRADRSPAPDRLARRGGVHHRSFARHSLDRQRGRGPLGQEAGQRGGPVGVGRRRATGGTEAGAHAADAGAFEDDVDGGVAVGEHQRRQRAPGSVVPGVGEGEVQIGDGGRQEVDDVALPQETADDRVVDDLVDCEDERVQRGGRNDDRELRYRADRHHEVLGARPPRTPPCCGCAHGIAPPASVVGTRADGRPAAREALPDAPAHTARAVSVAAGRGAPPVVRSTDTAPGYRRDTYRSGRQLISAAPESLQVPGGCHIPPGGEFFREVRCRAQAVRTPLCTRHHAGSASWRTIASPSRACVRSWPRSRACASSPTPRRCRNCWRSPTIWIW